MGQVITDINDMRQKKTAYQVVETVQSESSKVRANITGSIASIDKCIIQAANVEYKEAFTPEIKAATLKLLNMLKQFEAAIEMDNDLKELITGEEV